MADGTIDSLQIEIEASSRTAINHLNKLAAALNGVKEAAKGDFAGEFKRNLDKLGETETSKLTNLASALREVKEASTKTLSKTFGENIGILSGALKAISPDAIANLRSLGSAMKTFTGVENVKIPKDFADRILDIAEASSEISPDAGTNLRAVCDALKNSLGALDEGIAGKVQSIGDALTYFTHIKTGNISQSLPTRLAEIGTVIRQFNEGDIQALNSVTAGLQKLSGSSFNISEATPQRLQELLDTLANIDESAIKRIDRITESLQRLSNINLSGLRGATQGLSDVLGGSNFLAASRGLTSTMKGLTSAVNKAGKLYKIINSLGRVAFYRLIRSAIKAVTDALQKGTERAYQYSKAMGDSTAGVNTIAQAYDNLASASFKMSNQLGAAWASLIRAIEPIVIRIISLVTRLMDALTMLFAAFGGSGTYLKAVDYNKEWAKSASGAAGAAKEWKNQLMGFDEINRLEEPSSGGGGGGGGEPTDWGNMFNITPISSEVQAIVDMVKNHIAELELFAAGALLGIGLALTFSGANVPLGLAMIVAGATGLVAAIVVNWDYLTANVKNALSSVELLASGFLFGIGLALATSGANLPIGLALMGVGAAGLIGATALNWSDMPENIRRVLGDIELILGGAMMGVGIMLALATPALSPLGLALIGAGAATLATATAINWDYMTGNISNTLNSIIAVVSAAALAVGIILALTGANVPLGVAMVVAGAAGLYGAANLNWDWLAKKLEGTLGFIATIAGGSLLVLGLILACSGVALPLGLALMVAGGAVLGVGAAHYDWDALPKKISELCEKVKRTFNNMWQAIKNFFVTHMSNVTAGFITFISGLKNILQGIINFVAGIFTGDWARAWSGVTQIFSGVFQTISGWISAAVGWLSSLISWISSALSWVGSLGGRANRNAAAIQADGSVYLQGFASGGYPTTGQVFISRESGPELVGTIGGRTAVANNEEIISGIKEGVFEAVVAAMNGSGQSDQPIIISLDGREIARTTTKYQNQTARAKAV